MDLSERLDRWKQRGVISPEQHTLLAGLSRNEPFSLFLELNILLYAGVVAFVAGLGWTVTTWSQQLGDVLVVTVLSALFAACLWYCETAARSLIFDYVLYFGCLTWTVEFAYLENRFHFLNGQWDAYLPATAALFFLLAYRFDNRFVLSLALSSLAGWFGLKVSHWPEQHDEAYRQSAIVYSIVVAGSGTALRQFQIRAHFFETYLNIAANVLFWALLSGVFRHEGYGAWFAALIVAAGASLIWGVARRRFSFVAYAAVYGYIGLSTVLVRNINDGTAIMTYFVITGVAMLALLIGIARRFGRPS
jgi:hypothetical protein